MGHPFNQKRLATLDFRAIGEVVQSPINLEVIGNGKWVALDGRICNRGDYPELAPYFPAGAFTSTARTLNASPVVAAIDADATNFLAPGAAGTSPLQYSTDGITWNTSATWTAGTSPASLIKAGPRFVMAGSGGDLTVPYVSNINQAAAATKSNWTATTVGGTTTLTQGLAYSPQLGRTVLIPDAAGTTIWTLDDGATAWVARTHSTSRTKSGVICTGSQFIVACGVTDANKILKSSDGITWTEQSLPARPDQISGVASDGNGTVLLAGNYYTVGVTLADNGWFASKDHGATWRWVSAPPIMIANVMTAYFVNGLFVSGIIGAVNTNNAQLLSKDGLSWIEYRLDIQGPEVITRHPKIGAYKSGVYCFTSTASTAAFTSVEDASKFLLPRAHSLITTAAGAANPMNAYMPYMRAKS